MKKLLSILTLLALLLSFSSCSSKLDLKAPDNALRIVMTNTDDDSVTITDRDFIKNITDHINYFDYKKVKEEDLKNVSSCYTIEWFDENDDLLKTVSLYSDGTGIFFEGKQYEIDGDLYLDIPYFDLMFENFDGRTIYRLPLSLVTAIFGAKTIEAFWEVELPFYADGEDLRDTAYLDGELLLLFMSEEQEKQLLSHFDSGLEEFAAKDGVTLEKDYSKITITKPASETDEFLFYNFPLYAPHEMVLRQIFSGKDPSSISAEVVVLDEATGETLYSASWPHEEFTFEW